MLISEIFHSIQGEGELTGVPSVFIRTCGCNLRCDWCDTPYASWEPEGREMRSEEILNEIRKYPTQNCVITGGEPMVAKEIHDLAVQIKAMDKHITIETAGTVSPDGIPCDLASISPKLSHSTPPDTRDSAWNEKHEGTRLQHEVICQWIENYPYQLKFVVRTADDLPEIQTLLESLQCDIPANKVLLMPEGTDIDTIHNRNDTLIEICKDHGYRYCNRLQIELFGNTRGT
jgi:7-carboxy-7-deazaguanine synthase